MNSKRKLLSLSFSIIAALFILSCLSQEASALAAPPANDNFANAQDIFFPALSIAGTNVEATKQPGEPNHAGNPGGKSVWYKWTAPSTYSVTFDTQNGALADSLLAVYTGASVNALTLVASNDDYGSTNGGGRSRLFFPAVNGATYYIAVDGYSGQSASFILRWNPNGRPSHGSDFDGSGDDDIAVFRPSNGTWYSLLTFSNALLTLQFGADGDVPVPADYDGDAKTDFAVFRPSNGTWYVFRSRDSTVFVLPFGTNGDIPTPGDFSADGYADFAVFRPSNGTWYIRDYQDVIGFTAKPFGQSGDKPAQADYDGDGKVDVAVFRPSNGYWYILNSFDNSFRAVGWGTAGDIPVRGDYGTQFDGKADIAVFRPSNGGWYVLRSLDNTLFAVQWGQSGDIPQPMDTETNTGISIGSDFVIFRPSTNIWYILDGFDFSTKFVQWGGPGDIPASSAFVVQP